VIIGKIKKTKVIYDCRELFGFLAGLKDKKFVQKLWSFIEKIFISKADIVITTGKMDSDFLVSKFDLENLIVIRNLPMFKKTTAPFNYYDKLKIIPSKKILLYQGVVVHGRGIRLIFKVLQLTDEFVLIILGDGEHLYHYKNLAEEMKISDRVFFIGKVSQQDLSNYTAGAFAGLSLIENLSLSYYYALPNKLFEYIMAEVPVVVTDLPQMKEIVELYKVGIVTNENDIELLKNELENLAKNDYHYSELKNNCKIASEELCWEREFKFLSQRVQSFFS
jgi:glycosyltransferase involved in cell wall biosynthesis